MRADPWRRTCTHAQRTLIHSRIECSTYPGRGVVSDLGRARVDVAGVGSKVVQTADGTNRICSCARLRVFDPCNPPPAEEAWNEFGSCGPECQGVGESRSILVLPVQPVDVNPAKNPAGCTNGQCWDLKACWAPVTPAELGIEVPEAVRSASLWPRVCT